MKIAHQVKSLVLLSSLLTGSCFAFDTGPHQDLTRAVLVERGFGEDGIKAVQVENWLTDYYSSSPTYPKDRRAVLEKLHFDNLFTAAQVDNYWALLTNNLKSATQKAARDGDKMAMLAVMGIGLHAVQDFYAHSNWVETHPRLDTVSYRTDTYLGALGSTPKITVKDLHNGKYPADRTSGPGPAPIPADTDIHGGYDAGMNHDSHVRPRWDEAYVFAYCASHELVAAFEKWADEVRPEFWKSVQIFAADADQKKKLDYDIVAARNISMWFKGEGQDGHWKGNRSGSTPFFAAFSSKWVAANSSVFVRTIRDGRIQDQLAADLYSGKKAQPPPVFERFSLRKRAIVFHATYISESKDKGLFSKLPGVGGPDFYSRIKIGGQEYWGRTLQHAHAATDPWTEIGFVDQAVWEVPIMISIWDEGNIDAIKDQAVNINAEPGKSVFERIFRLSDPQLVWSTDGIYGSDILVFQTEGVKPDDHRAFFSARVSEDILR